jgi:hypothetical protein
MAIRSRFMMLLSFLKKHYNEKEGQMSLTRDIYKEFEDIVGPENISQDPGILDSYSYQFMAELFFRNHWTPRPEAVVLPATTEEVQAIVKACNRLKLRFKALSTGWGPWNAPSGPGVIQVDLRRMNRILDIDEKNLFAVVEPYVTAGQLQGELMRRGLCCNIIGAGANTTAFTAAKYTGYGQLGVTHSTEGRNLLAVEWVLPSGDILKLGSLGSDAGWFCGDGPGPSLRGVLRGLMGAMGGNGVYTKCATKIYHWSGPPIPPIKGIAPNYRLDPVPKLFKTWIFFFPSWEKFTNFAYKVGESEIAYMIYRASTHILLTVIARSNLGYKDFIKHFNPPDKITGWQVLITANTQAEFDYKKKVLRQIAIETDAKSWQIVEHPYVQGAAIWGAVRAALIARAVFRPTGTFSSTFGSMGTIDSAVNEARVSAKLKQKFINQGEILDDGADVSWGIPYEGGHTMHLENPVCCHPTPEGIRGMRHFLRAADEAYLNPPQDQEGPVTGSPLGAFTDGQHNRFGPKMCNYHIWLEKIKKAFDPNNISDAYFYITAKE